LYESLANGRWRPEWRQLIGDSVGVGIDYGRGETGEVVGEEAAPLEVNRRYRRGIDGHRLAELDEGWVVGLENERIGELAQDRVRRGVNQDQGQDRQDQKRERPYLPSVAKHNVQLATCGRQTLLISHDYNWQEGCYQRP
jgi:hypothetical protein